MGHVVKAGIFNFSVIHSIFLLLSANTSSNIVTERHIYIIFYLCITNLGRQINF